MRLWISAAGRLKPGPEKTLVDDYLSRFAHLGRSLGLKTIRLIEVDNRHKVHSSVAGQKESEARRLLDGVPAGARLVVLDERGETSKSTVLAQLLAGSLDEGIQDMAFLIGGDQGLPASLLEKADYRLSFGRQTWPHMLVRVMLTEQLYRASAILANHPYHRE